MFAYLPSLNPMLFFHKSFSCPYTKKGKLDSSHQLPSFSKLFSEEEFASVFLGWNEEGLYIFVDSDESVISIDRQEPRRGDSIEIFIDTRWSVSSSSFSKFCHHFAFFPIGGDEGALQGVEISRFRSEDMHLLADPYDLEVKTTFKKTGYTSAIFIPAKAIHGFDPEIMDSFGFTYRINREAKPSQHFTCRSTEFSIESHPSFWAEIKMVSK